MNKIEAKRKFKKGMTLAEMIIAISIFSIISVAVSKFFVDSWRNYKLILDTNQASVAANQGSAKITDVLRRVTDGSDGSFAILSASDFDLKVFSDIDKDDVIEKVHYYLSGDDLMVGISEASGFPLAYPSGDTEVQTVISDVTNSTSQPIFYYYNNQNQILSSPVSSLIDIKMVETSLFVERREGDLNIVSDVSLRNLSDNN